MAKKQTNGNLALEQQRVIVIPAHDEIIARKLRVAAYARVSSSSEDQLNSYRVQNQYYSELISGNPDWEMVDIYADEGITGTSVEKREDFQRMMRDCRKGKIDRILVKSISRFARNTKDCLAAIRELKELGVSVQFEEQGIDTSKVSSEMVTAIMASLAQKQSEAISGNVKWGVQKRMQDGTFIPSYLPYGYEAVGKKICINEEQALIVRQSFHLDFLAGRSIEQVAADLRTNNIPCKNGRVQWDSSSVRYILRNEKYTGNSKWQKYYTPNTFPFHCKNQYRRRCNTTGQRIHIRQLFQIWTYSVWRRKLLRKQIETECARTHNQSISVAPEDGIAESCGSRILRQKEKSMHTVYWVCLGHDRGQNCDICQVPEDTINAAFCRLYYKLKHNGNPIFTQMLSNLQKVRYSRMLWSEDVISLNKKISDILSQVQFLAQLQQAGGVDPDTFISSNNKLSEQLRRLKQEKARLLDTDSDDLADRTRDLMDALEDGPDFLDGFDAELFDALVEKIIVDSNERLRFRLEKRLGADRAD
ncbi:MAG: recombinase family protein [Oscillospiraceae bacterium]